MDIVKARREMNRWTIILTLNNARPIGASEELILSVIQSVNQDATALEIRRELDYLEVRELVKVNRSPNGHWTAELSRHGVDLAEYTVDCDPGIARPVKYWAT